ncbi:MAG: sigma-70 family RNA polymerase sigma factor [Planctomycetota bacterium]
MRDDDNKRKEFEELAMPHIDALYSMALRYIFNKEEAEDLVQETYLKAYRFFSTFQQGTNIKAWLFKILRNTFINKYRKATNMPGEVLYEGLETLSTEQTTVQEDISGKLTDTLATRCNNVSNLMEDDIKHAIESLPLEYREAILLSDVEELSYKDISEIANVPVGTVKSRLNRGRKLLQKSLWEYAKDRGFIDRRK